MIPWFGNGTTDDRVISYNPLLKQLGPVGRAPASSDLDGYISDAVSRLHQGGNYMLRTEVRLRAMGSKADAPSLLEKGCTLIEEVNS